MIEGFTNEHQLIKPASGSVTYSDYWSYPAISGMLLPATENTSQKSWSWLVHTAWYKFLKLGIHVNIFEEIIWPYINISTADMAKLPTAWHDHLIPALCRRTDLNSATILNKVSHCLTALAVLHAVCYIMKLVRYLLKCRHEVHKQQMSTYTTQHIPTSSVDGKLKVKTMNVGALPCCWHV